MYELVRVVQTCYGCPSQWDGWDKDGIKYYMRYRGGVMRVHRDVAEFDHQGICDQYSDWMNRVIERETWGDSLDGVISLDDFVKRSQTISLSANCIREGVEEW